ncbi:hypothetical protein, partial [Clostridium perfringens]
SRKAGEKILDLLFN